MSVSYPGWYRQQVDELDAELLVNEAEWIAGVFDDGINPAHVTPQVQLDGYRVDFVFTGDIAVEVVNSNPGDLDRRTRIAHDHGYTFVVAGEPGTPHSDCDEFFHYEDTRGFGSWLRKQDDAYTPRMI